MSSGNLGNDEAPVQKNSQSRGLLGAGWRPLPRQFEWDFLLHLVSNDSLELTQKTLKVASSIADALGRNYYAWWANFLNVFSENTRYELDEFWNYITPEPPVPDHRYGEVISVETPVNLAVTRNSIPINYVLNRLEETTVFKVLELLGKPELITQYYIDRHFYYPASRFVSWERLEIIGTVFAHWSKDEVWLQIENLGKGRRQYTLIAKDIAPLVNKATYNLAVMLSGYQSRVGQVQSQFPIRTFPADIQSFTDTVQQAILDQNQLAVLVMVSRGLEKQLGLKQ